MLAIRSYLLKEWRHTVIYEYVDLLKTRITIRVSVFIGSSFILFVAGL